jgi:D-alanyl-D-alanine carboxypeptidase
MNRIRSVIILLILLILSTFLTARVHADAIDDYLRDQMSEHHIPGLALKIIRDGREAKSAHYGLANLEHNIPVTDRTVFEIGSLTKQFTAACILMLQQDGRLSIADPISKHLTNTPAAWSNITVRHLLTHTSGLKNYTGLSGFDLSRRLTQAQFIATLGAQPLDFAPGEQARYCNSGFNLLGYIIENVSGQTYWDFLAARIFGPLGMSTATNRDPVILVPQRADGYEWKNGAQHNRDFNLTDIFAAGAIVMSLGDLAKWNASLETGSDKLLTAASKAQMWTPQRLNNGTAAPYGFGWRVGEQEGHRNIGHSGSTSGFSASLQRYPDDRLTVILLCNSDEQNIATTLARAVARMSFGE